MSPIGSGSWHLPWLLAMLAILAGTPGLAAEGTPDLSRDLDRDLFKNGDRTLEAFRAVATATRASIGKLDVAGRTVALATVIDRGGLALTKASELREGRLTCWVSGGREVDAEVVGTDEESDIALVRIHATDLTPIAWASGEIQVGQWAVTPGIEEAVHAVGVVSVVPRRILHERALIGVQLDAQTSAARIREILAGLGADRAGLRAGDVILSVEDQAVETGRRLVEVLREARAGQTVRLLVRRGDREFEVSVLMSLPGVEPGAPRLNREERMNRMGGEVSRRSAGFAMALQHDTVLPPWLCGGPVVNLDGEAIGLNIARAGRVATYALPVDLVREVIERLIRPGPPG